MIFSCHLLTAPLFAIVFLHFRRDFLFSSAEKMHKRLCIALCIFLFQQIFVVSSAIARGNGEQIYRSLLEYQDDELISNRTGYIGKSPSTITLSTSILLGPNVKNVVKIAGQRQTCDCGLYARPFIVGGEHADAREFPWFAAITKFQHNKQPRWKVICGAALLNQNFAITAGHCLHNRYKDTLEVVFNIKNASTIETDSKVVRRKIKRFVVHPQYDPNTQHDDIALVQFKAPIDLQTEVPKPICVPNSARNTYASKQATIVGFGHTTYGSGSDQPKENSQTLKKVGVPILSHGECLKSKVPTKKNITEKMICAGSQHKDACINDSGGPLMVTDGGRATIVGIASWGVGCGLQGYPGVYTRITQYLSWIKTASESSCN